MATGTLGALSTGGNLVVGGTTIGLVTSNAGGVLVLSFNASATQALVNAALQQIGYQNSSDAPAASVQIDWTFSDGNTGAQGSGGALSITASTTVTITAINDAPVLSDGGSMTNGEGSASALFFGVGTLTDADSPDFAGGSLTATISGGGEASDQLFFQALGAVSTVGADLKVNGVTVGTWSGGTGGTPLIASFNSNATASDVQAVFEAICFTTTSNASTTGLRTISVVATDGDGGTSNTATAEVNLDTLENDAPVLADTALNLSVAEDAGVPSGAVGNLISSWTGGITDPDGAGAAKGIAIVASDETHGTWYYSTDGGSTWNAVGAVSAGASLLLADNASTRLAFAPATNYNGTAAAALTLRAWDQSTGTAGSKVDTSTTGDATAFSAATDVVNVTVTAVNDAPTTSDVMLPVLVEDGGPRLITQADLLANAADTEGGLLVATGLSLNSGKGTLTDNGDGTWTYTPELNDDGPADFSYSIGDDAYAYVQGRAILSRTSVNDAPTTSPVTLAPIAEDSGVRLITQAELLSQAADVDGYALVASDLTITGGGGVLADNGDGTWTYTPDANDNTSVSFSYTISDGAGGAVAGSASLDITPVNDAPTSSAITLAPIAEDSGARVITQAELLANATDVEGDTLSASALAISAGSGTLHDNGDGTWSYTPALNDASSVSFSYTISDGLGGSIAGTASLDLTPVQDAPSEATPIADQSATEDAAFTFQFPANSFVEVDAGDTLTYTTSSLPAWLSFNANTRTFSGTPVNGDVGTYTITVTATDGSGATASSIFDIVVGNTNDAPTEATPIADQAATEDSAFTFQFPANSFADVDAGDSLTYTANSLPAWLSFDANTRTFSGTPANGDVGTHTITVTATDGSGTTASSTFDIVVGNVNDAPTEATPIADQAATEDSAFTFQFPANSFADMDAGDSLTYTTSSLPAWLSFNANTRTFSGTPANGDVGTHSITVTATDGSGATASSTFGIVVGNTNDAPTEATPIADQAATEDSAFTFQFPANSFADVDAGDSLTYTTNSLPAWLSFDANTWTFSGTPANGDVGTHTITVTATDGSGAAASSTFDIVVGNTNDAPTEATPIADQAATEDSAFTFQFPANSFADVDAGDTLTYTTNSLPAWLSFDANTRTFSGTPANGDVGTHTITVTATDGSGATASSTFDIVVGNVNDTPTEATPIADQAATEDSAFTFQFPANSFADVDAGDTLTYTTGVLPAWLSFDAGNRTFSGTPANGDVGTHTITVTATDGSGATASSTFDIVVGNVNDTPTEATPIADQAATEDSAFTFQFPANSFADVDAGDSLTYTANSLPAWLSFDANTRTFSGTPANGDVGTHTITVTATDGSGATASSTFDIVVGNVNDAPTEATPIADQSATEDSAFNFQFPANSFADVDAGDSLTYTTNSLPAWLSFDANTRTFSGTPANGDVGTHTITVTATDGSGTTASSTFDIVVGNVNDAPTEATPIADQAATEDSAFTFQFPANSFADVDAGDSLTYTTNSLPAWLSFDANTRTFSGTPANGDVGTHSITVTATDGSGATASSIFDIVVGNTNDAPTEATPIADQAATEDSAFTFQFPANSFADVDAGDSLTYTTNSLPTWLSFNSGTRTFSGTPANGDVGTHTITVTATDGSGATASSTFDIVVGNTNDAPTEATPIADQSATEDSAFTFQFPANTFADVDAGDTLTYTTNSLPTWLSFDANTRTFSGTPANGDVGTHTITVTATDGSGATATSTFVIVVGNVNDAPTESTPIADQSATEDSAFTFQFPTNSFADVDAGDSLTYTTNSLPAWLSFDANTRTFSGTPANGDVGTHTITVTATDGSGATASSTFDIVVGNTNDAPTEATPIADQSATEDAAFTFQFPANTFADVDAGDTLTYTTNSLPAWLSFDANTRTFSGTPANGDVGTHTITVTATDGSGATASSIFDIVVGNTNDAPTEATPIADQAATEDSAFTFQFPANSFADVDAGDSLTYTTNSLPTWLSFNSGTRTFSGTPANGDVGTHTITVTATDGSGATASSTFDIVVGNVNDAPTEATPIADQAATEDAAFTFQFPANSFADVDAGDTLTYTTSSLPAWLSFDAGTRTFSGTPANGDVGTHTITVTATDGSGATASSTFDIVVGNTNDAPTEATPIADQAATEDAAFAFQFPANSFADVDAGDTLTYTTSSLPAWLSFDAGTRTFSGTPANGDVGTHTITVTATDGSGATTSSSFDIVVGNTNDAPTESTPIPDQSATEDAAFTFQFPANSFADVDAGDSLTYTTNSLPAWLSFDAGTRTFSGTPANGDVGTHTITVTATDGSGASASSTFDIVVGNTNDAPTEATPIADQVATEDTAFSFQFPANSFADVDVGDSLTYTTNSLPAWLSFDAGTRTFSGTPANGDVGTHSITVTATDGSGATATSIFDIVVGNTNDAPTEATPIADQAATEDSAFTFQFPANSFSDVDSGDTLTYTTSSLPAWLSFDAGTRTFSGTPANGDIGTYSITVTATDGSGASASSTFDIVVGNTNDAPTEATPIADQSATEDTAFSFQFAANSFADVDAGDSLTYTTSSLPSWLSFNAGTRTFSGTPANGDVGTHTITVTATDGSGATATSTFDIVVGNTNDAPTEATPIADQSATEDASFTFQVPANSFADVDAGDALTYTTSSLPTWLSFNASTRTFSGTPANGDVGTHTITVTATDGSGAAASSNFDIVVGNVNDAPTEATPIADQSATEDSAFSFQFPASSFADLDAGDSLSYSTSALPSWLSFDAGTRTFSGTPANGDVGVHAITVTATDGSGATASSTFDIVVGNVNDAPTEATAIADQVATEDSPFAFQFPANSFSDMDVGDTLSYSTSALPSWLSFNASTRSFSGTPANGDVGTHTITVTATDDSGASASSTFDIIVGNTNDAPTEATPIADQSATEDSAFSFQFAANSFADVDSGDSLSYTTSALPSWLSFNAATRTFSGTPTNADVGTHTITVTATDASGASASSTFDIVVANVNSAPTGLPAVIGTAQQNETLSVDVSTLADGDGLGVYAYQWLRDGAVVAGANGATYVIGNADVGTQLSVRVSYIDAQGTAESLTSAASAAVANVNDSAVGRPVIVGEVVEQQTLSADLAGISDADGLGPVSFQWLRNGVAIVGATGATYTLGSEDIGAPISVRVSYTDAQGTPESVTSAETPPVRTSNLAPVLTSATVWQVAENTSIAGTLSATDANGDALTYRLIGGADAALFDLDPATGELRWKQAPDFEAPTDADRDQTYEVLVEVADGRGGSDQQAIAIEVVNTRDQAPSWPGGDRRELQILENDKAVAQLAAKADGPGLPLSYRVAGGEDADLFTIDPTTGSLQFKRAPDREAPQDADRDGVYVVQVVATDGQFAAVQTLVIAVANVDEAPTVVVSDVTLLDRDVVTLKGQWFAASDVDSDAATLVFTIKTSEHGHFALADATTVVLTSFTQADIDAQRVVYVLDGSAQAPSYEVELSDGKNIQSFRAQARIHQPSARWDENLPVPAGSELNRGVPAKSAEAIPPATAPLPTGTGGSEAQERAPSELQPALTSRDLEGRSTQDGMFDPSAAGNGSLNETDAWQRTRAADLSWPQTAPTRSGDSHEGMGAGLGGYRFEADLSLGLDERLAREARLVGMGYDEGPMLTARVERPVSFTSDRATTPGRAAFSETDAQGERHADDQGQDQGLHLDIEAADLSRAGTAALSVGALFWISRAGGLISSLLMSLPAWRQFDPLPIMAMEEDERHASGKSKRRSNREAFNGDTIGDLDALAEDILDRAKT